MLNAVLMNIFSYFISNTNLSFSGKDPLGSLKLWKVKLSEKTKLVKCM